MIKRISAVCCLLAILFSVAGCQLAKEESVSAGGDRLIGVLITTEHLDLFDFEGYMNDHIGQTSNGGEITPSGDNDKYNGRLYATQSITEGHADYVFEGVSGIRFFEVRVPATETTDAYHALIGSDGICDAKTSITAGDADSLVLEGTVYVTPEASGHSYFFNPVYQDANGKVYVTTGSGSMNSGASAEGMVFSQSYKESHTATENGKQKTGETSVTITVSIKHNAEKLVILQMGDDYSILAQDEYAPGSLPESISPGIETSFIIVESYNKDMDGKTQVSRALYNNQETEYIRSYHDRGDGIMLAQDTKINWQ